MSVQGRFAKTASAAAAAPKMNLKQLAAAVAEVSSIPTVVTQILEVAHNDKSTVGDLMRVVETDPSLSSKVLRMVNSSSFCLPERVHSIHRAICLLGFNQVKSLAVSLSVADVFRQAEPMGTYSRSGLWKHMVCVGAVAKLIAMRTGSGLFEEAFVAGLLHDLGIILMDQYAHPQFVQVLERSNQTARPMYEVERELLGFDHGALGAEIGRRWRFPPATLAAIEFHHRGAAAPKEAATIVACVELANAICTKKGMSSTGSGVIAPPRIEALQLLRINREGLLVLMDEVDQEVAKYSVLFSPGMDS
jgi:HD-like signal output (HDOD) protein